MAYVPSMMIIQDKLVSMDLLLEEFVCNLTACKGACCWEGDFGAPLEAAELETLNRIYPDIEPYLSPAGKAAIATNGTYVQVTDGDGDVFDATTLIEGGPCAYITYDQNGIAMCGIEKAWLDGATDFRKPISCQLYPIRVEKNEESGFEALNYHRWEICSAACSHGQKLGVPVYRFLKDAIVRAYGEEFYNELDDIAQDFGNQDA